MGESVYIGFGLMSDESILFVSGLSLSDDSLLFESGLLLSDESVLGFI